MIFLPLLLQNSQQRSFPTSLFSKDPKYAKAEQNEISLSDTDKRIEDPSRAGSIQYSEFPKKRKYRNKFANVAGLTALVGSGIVGAAYHKNIGYKKAIAEKYVNQLLAGGEISTEIKTELGVEEDLEKLRDLYNSKFKAEQDGFFKKWFTKTEDKDIFKDPMVDRVLEEMGHKDGAFMKEVQPLAEKVGMRTALCAAFYGAVIGGAAWLITHFVDNTFIRDQK